jgi:hypothetical protein
MGILPHSNEDVDNGTFDSDPNDELAMFNGNAFGSHVNYMDDNFGQDTLAQEPSVQENDGELEVNFDE